jgi:hypothetical protein
MFKKIHRPESNARIKEEYLHVEHLSVVKRIAVKENC